MIISYNKNEELKVLSNNKIYLYYKVNPFYHDKINRLFNKGFKGKAFKILKKFTFKSIE